MGKLIVWRGMDKVVLTMTGASWNPWAQAGTPPHVAAGAPGGEAGDLGG